MVSEELVERVREKFQHGVRRQDIKESLMNEGIHESDVDAAIRKIQHDAVKQLPFISKIYRTIEHLDSKENLQTPHMTIALMIACVVGLLILAGALYFIFDPLGTRAVARDAHRQADAAQIQTALANYYLKNKTYPSSLTHLIPSYMLAVPKDPQTGVDYQYKATDTNYQLCVSLELQSVECWQAPQSANDIPVIPTDTPYPTYVPQSASGGKPNAL